MLLPLGEALTLTKGGHKLAAWEIVCKLKYKGGSGIINSCPK
jgi:hypothetical protein